MLNRLISQLYFICWYFVVTEICIYCMRIIAFECSKNAKCAFYYTPICSRYADIFYVSRWRNDTTTFYPSFSCMRLVFTLIHTKKNQARPTPLIHRIDINRPDLKKMKASGWLGWFLFRRSIQHTYILQTRFYPVESKLIPDDIWKTFKKYETLLYVVILIYSKRHPIN